MTRPKPRPIKQMAYVDLLAYLDGAAAMIDEVDLPELRARVQHTATCCEIALKLTAELERRLKQAGLLEG